MNTMLRIGLGIVIAVALVIAGLGAGWMLWGHRLWTGWGYGRGPGMMGRWGGPAASCAEASWECAGPGVASSGANARSDKLTIEEAHEAVERYVEALGYTNLEIAELMEFEHIFYAIVREMDSGIGAMELLVDKWTGDVGPEMGPNMMWNGRYGMHGRGGMMGGAGEVNTIASEEALEIAQDWLNTNRTEVTVEEHADPFYGYYTIHTVKDGEIGRTGTVRGMLSVHGVTGQVWYHTWHGEFIQMIEEDDH